MICESALFYVCVVVEKFEACQDHKSYECIDIQLRHVSSISFLYQHVHHHYIVSHLSNLKT